MGDSFYAKNKKILMVVLLFVVTLNINYLGMMVKSIIVESSEYKKGNTTNLVFGAYDEDYYVYRSGERYYQTKDSCLKAVENEEDCECRELASKEDKMYCKIIRVNGDGSLMLIYNGTGPTSFSEEISGVIGITPYNLKVNDLKYSGYTYDNGTDSFIKKEVDTWYNNTLGSNPTTNSALYIGIGLILILVLGTGAYITYRIKNVADKNKFNICKIL